MMVAVISISRNVAPGSLSGKGRWDKLPRRADVRWWGADRKLVVYSHIVYATVTPVPDVPEHLLVTRTRATYDGPLLMSFVIDDMVQALDAKGRGDPAAGEVGRSKCRVWQTYS
jgi:hypothetical protein